MTTVKVGNARLLKLAEFLEKLPRKRFDFTHWVDDDATEKSCGTTACALGWAATMPAFRRLGFKLRPLAEGSRYFEPSLPDSGNPLLDAETLFALTDEQAYDLFVPQGRWDLRPGALKGDATPKQVAKNLRKFVKARSE